MKTLKLKKDVVEQLNSNQAQNVMGGADRSFDVISCTIICYPPTMDAKCASVRTCPITEVSKELLCLKTADCVSAYPNACITQSETPGCRTTIPIVDM